MRRAGGGSVSLKGKSKMRGSLHYGTNGEAVRASGRDDERCGTVEIGFRLTLKNLRCGKNDEFV
jgi:hypothetical protein